MNGEQQGDELDGSLHQALLQVLESNGQSWEQVPHVRVTVPCIIVRGSRCIMYYCTSEQVHRVHVTVPCIIVRGSKCIVCM